MIRLALFWSGLDSPSLTSNSRGQFPLSWVFAIAETLFLSYVDFLCYESLIDIFCCVRLPTLSIFVSRWTIFVFESLIIITFSSWLPFDEIRLAKFLRSMLDSSLWLLTSNGVVFPSSIVIFLRNPPKLPFTVFWKTFLYLLRLFWVVYIVFWRGSPGVSSSLRDFFWSLLKEKPLLTPSALGTVTFIEFLTFFPLAFAALFASFCSLVKK